MTDTQTTREKMVSAAAGVSGSLQDAAHQAKPTFERLADQLSDNISDMAHHSRDAAVETKKLLDQKTHQVSASAEHYIHCAPFKSVLIAAGVGAFVPRALKVEGINDCAEVLVAALMDDREKHIFGRRTLPEMDMASLSCAIQNLWLASRAEGLGMGWVSLFEPQALADLLGLPPLNLSGVRQRQTTTAAMRAVAASI